MTHEAFIEAIRQLAAARIAGEAKARLLAAKLVYGAGSHGVRGITYFDCWHNGSAESKLDVIEIAAMAEESATQLAGTTLHELGHSLAGWSAGHGADWKEACMSLGLMKCAAAGQSYGAADFAPDMWVELEALRPSDGSPIFGKGLVPAGTAPAKPRPCSVAIGTRGGKSRGVGSGSRLKLYVCACGTKVRAVRGAGFDATCNKCSSPFAEAGGSGSAAEAAVHGFKPSAAGFTEA